MTGCVQDLAQKGLEQPSNMPLFGSSPLDYQPEAPGSSFVTLASRTPQPMDHRAPSRPEVEQASVFPKAARDLLHCEVLVRAGDRLGTAARRRSHRPSSRGGYPLFWAVIIALSAMLGLPAAVSHGGLDTSYEVAGGARYTADLIQPPALTGFAR